MNELNPGKRLVNCRWTDSSWFTSCIDTGDHSGLQYSIIGRTYTVILPARRSKRCPCYGNVSGWLGGWPAECTSHVGIVSKRLNLSENFSTVWKPRHSSFLRPLRRYTTPRGTPLMGALNTRGGWEKMAIFVRFSTDIAVYLGNGAR